MTCSNICNIGRAVSEPARRESITGINYLFRENNHYS